MPCDGPSQEYAFKIADELYDQVVELLEAEHIRRDVFLSGKDKETQKTNFDKLKETLRDIVWHDHASSF